MMLNNNNEKTGGITKILFFLCFLCLLSSVLCLTGCSTAQMKGTPFYSGEYEGREGPTEDRVNLWPLLYYRDPALSVLWPLVELTDDHFAFRPFMSIYDFDTDKKVYNVLWPLVQIDQQTGDNRVFPVFWGNGDVTAFPLYWNRGEPFGEKGGSDTFIPLWSYRKNAKGYSAYVLWPFMHLKNMGQEKGWHVWPFCGSYADKDNGYRFLMWPLAHQWFDHKGTESGHSVLPLYFYNKNRDNKLFVSLPYSKYSCGDGLGWQLAPPFFYHSRDDHGSRLITLLYYSASSDSGAEKSSVLFPFYYLNKTEDKRMLISLPYSRYANRKGAGWHLIPPFFYQSRDEEGNSNTFTPLYFSGSDSSGYNGWNGLFPFYYYSKANDGSMVATLLGGYKKDKDGLGWVAAPLLSAGSATKDGSSTWVLGPLAHFKKDKGYRSNHVFPFYYYGSDSEGSLFLSLLWSSGRNADGGSWQVAPPFFYRIGHPDGQKLITFLYYWDGKKKTFISPLYAGWKSSEKNSIYLCPPLLSLLSSSKEKKDLWSLGGLVRASWGEKPGSQHVLPLYYYDRSAGTFISPLAATWKKGEQRTVLAPPLLSWMDIAEKRKDLWMLGALAHASWGENPGSQHVFPLYYFNKNTGTVITPLGARWKKGDRSTIVAPPLLSWMDIAEKRKDLWMLGALAHASWGEKANSNHVFPFYYMDKKHDSFLSLLYASWRYNGTKYMVSPPLLSGYSDDGRKKALSVLLGLFYNKKDVEKDNTYQHLFPFYTYDSDKYFYTPLFGWNKSKTDGFIYPFTPLTGLYRGDSSGAWFWPFFSHKRNRNTKYLDGNYLLVGQYKSGDGYSKSYFPFVYSYNRKGSIEKGIKSGARYATYGKSLNVLLFFWYKNQLVVRPDYRARKDGDKSALSKILVKKHGFFPLWNYSRSKNIRNKKEDTSVSALMFLYDYKREMYPATDDSEEVDYVRQRVLWRLWHYEREKDDVSVDIFPAITYDRRKDDFKKVSFLWRFFRYERNQDRKEIDFLFIPVWRQGEKPAKDK